MGLGGIHETIHGKSSSNGQACFKRTGMLRLLSHCPLVPGVTQDDRTVLTTKTC